MYQSEGVKKTVDDWLEANPQYKDLYKEDSNPQARIVEEYLVSLVESAAHLNLAAIKHYLKELGRKMKIKDRKYTDSEVMTILGDGTQCYYQWQAHVMQLGNGFRYSMEGRGNNKDEEVRLENLTGRLTVRSTAPMQQE